MKLGVVVDNEFDADIRVTKSIRIAQQCGFDVAVLCYDYKVKQHPSHSFPVDRIKISNTLKNGLYLLFNRLPIYEYLWRYRIRQFVQKNNIDILHVHDLHLAKAAHLAVKGLNKKVEILLDLHENFPFAINGYNWTKNRFKSAIAQPKSWFRKEAKYLSYASQLIVLSTHFKQSLLDRYSFLKAKKIIVHPNIIDLQLFETFHTTVASKERHSLFYFGGVAERRGIFTVFQAMKNLIAKGHQPTLLIIGPVDKADQIVFKQWLKELNPFVTHKPWIPLSNLLSYMNTCDICLAPFIKNPQHDSGVANKIYQYMYGKKPIIASNCTPQQELIESAKCGIIYNNTMELEEAIVNLIQAEDKIELGSNGYERLMALSKEKNQLSSLYQSLLAG